MSSLSRFSGPTVLSAPTARSIAVAALLGATMLVSPLVAARAGTATDAAIQLAQAGHLTQLAAAPKSKAETIEQRITKLHSELKITADEETNWNSVAQAMRDNASKMDELVAANRAKSPSDMTALEDLKAYQEFAQAHADNLKNLISSFETLYNAMPDDQKKVADQVFQTFGHKHMRSHKQG